MNFLGSQVHNLSWVHEKEKGKLDGVLTLFREIECDFPLTPEYSLSLAQSQESGNNFRHQGPGSGNSRKEIWPWRPGCQVSMPVACCQPHSLGGQPFPLPPMPFD